MSAPETSELTMLLLASCSSGPVMFVGWMHLGKRIILEVFGYVHNLRSQVFSFKHAHSHVFVSKVGELSVGPSTALT